MKRYICTDYLRFRDGLYFFHPDTTFLSNKKEGELNYDISGYPEIFSRVNKLGETVWDLWRMSAGQQRMPRFSFDPDAYERGEYAFQRVDSWRLQWFRRNLRRKALGDDIHKEIRTDTELKKHRKALEAVIYKLSKIDSTVLDESSVKDFLDMSDSVEHIVKKVPKDSDVAEKRAVIENGEDVHWWFESPEEAYERAKEDEREDKRRGKREKAEADRERKKAARNKKK